MITDRNFNGGYESCTYVMQRESLPGSAERWFPGSLNAAGKGISYSTNSVPTYWHTSMSNKTSYLTYSTNGMSNKMSDKPNFKMLKTCTNTHDGSKWQAFNSTFRDSRLFEEVFGGTVKTSSRWPTAMALKLVISNILRVIAPEIIVALSAARVQFWRNSHRRCAWTLNEAWLPPLGPSGQYGRPRGGQNCCFWVL